MSASSQDAAAPAVHLEGITKQFPGFELGPLELSLDRGTVLALVGPNGAGKTTTLNCIAGLVRADSGELRVFGHRVGPDQLAFRPLVGYVGEESGFFKGWTAQRNLDFMAGLMPGWSKDRAQRLAERFALRLDTPVKTLSRGNRTKLSLVAALAYGPRLLLLDEPTAGLDPVVRAEVLDVLWETTEDGDHAVIYSTHVLSDISRLADELAFLRDGQLVLRSGREMLTEGWRRISFRLDSEIELEGVVEHRHVRAEHQVISTNAEQTLAQLAQLGAEAIEASRMSVDEIAVQILKEGHDVVRHSS